MLNPVAPERAYPPEIVTAMTTAFDRVCSTVSVQVSGDDGVRRQLALTLLRHVDAGEHDPMRLSELALNELAGVDVGGSLACCEKRGGQPLNNVEEA